MADRVCETFGRTYSESPLKLTGTRVYNVWLDEAPNRLSDVSDTTGIPDPGDSWDDSLLTYLLVVRRTPAEIDLETLFFQVRVDYETDETQLPWQIDIKTVHTTWVPSETLAAWTEHPPTFDYSRYLSPSGDGGDDLYTGYPPVNRAGDFFEDQPAVGRHLRQITLTRTVSSISDIGDSTIADVDDLTGYIGRMNISGLSIAGITGLTWEFLIDDISVERSYSASATYVYRVTIVILYDDFSWATPIANIGYRALKTSGGTKYVTPGRNVDGTGNNKPVVLDTDGTAVTDRVTGLSGASGPPYYIVFPFYLSVDFTPLQLPQVLEP